MRRNRKDNAKRERIIMLASSAFVLTALTMTGIYMQARNEESKDDGYTLDFTAVEDDAESKYQEIAQNNTEESIEDILLGGNTETPITGNMEDDLDYMPMEVDSGKVEIPGLTDIPKEIEEPLKEQENAVESIAAPVEAPQKTEEPQPTQTPQAEENSAAQETGSTQDMTVEKELHFSESNGLLRPLEGEVLIPFSMDKGVFFATLKDYRRNPALMLVAEEGMAVSACAEGKVVDIFEDEEIGHAVTMDLGDGYRLTYGQLKEINVSVGSYVNPGETVGVVAAPTKYYCVEGANLYLMLTMDGTPVDPEALFR